MYLEKNKIFYNNLELMQEYYTFKIERRLTVRSPIYQSQTQSILYSNDHDLHFFLFYSILYLHEFLLYTPIRLGLPFSLFLYMVQ